MILLTIAIIILFTINNTQCIRNNNKVTSTINSNPNNNIKNSYIINQEKLSILKLGKSLTQDGYLLATFATLMKISQGRSEVLDCIKLDDNISNCKMKLNTNEDINVRLYKAKITKDAERYKREKDNYQKICGSNGNDNFVKVIEFADEKLSGSSMVPKGGVIIQERGVIDLKVLSETVGPIRGKDLLLLVQRMISALARIHSCGLVWTDLKLENFVLVPLKDTSGNIVIVTLFLTIIILIPLEPLDNYISNTNYNNIIQKNYILKDYICKAIDVESAVPEKDSLVDFSPETCAPELASILRRGSISAARNRDFKVNVDEPLSATKALDIWALGISILHLYLGRAPIVDRADINKSLAKLDLFEQGKEDLGIKVYNIFISS